jgi:hypothetical protein
MARNSHTAPAPLVPWGDHDRTLVPLPSGSGALELDRWPARD